MNFPQTVDDLIRWDVSTGRDSFGTYHIITGFEGTGGCFWCGEELEGRRRFCGHRSGHSTLYAQHFYWTYARDHSKKRDGYRCVNCGLTETYWDGKEWVRSTASYSLEVHHIIPMGGAQRESSVFNVPWNLLSFCRDCHQLIHAVLRELSQPIPRDVFDLALAKGQAVFEPLRL